MKFLVAEDDFASRLLITKILDEFGYCQVAVDGAETVKAFELACREGEPFELICLDIMMPKLDGQQVLQSIRSLEEKYGILGLDGVKIIMITALDDSKSIRQAFRGGCEAYMTKPLIKADLLEEIRKLGVVLESKRR